MDENNKSDKNDKSNKSGPTWLSEIVKAVVIIAITIVISYKVITTPFNLTMDAVTFLSMLLALFSVWLSALFYFKATDTSNAFYDNTYKFTKEIAELLVKIESGFGERLRHLDEGYTKMQDHIIAPASKQEIEKARQKITEIEKERDEKQTERDQLLEELAKKAKLEDIEKRRLFYDLDKKEQELRESQHILKKMSSELNELRKTSNDPQKRALIVRYMRKVISEDISIKNMMGSSQRIQEEWGKLLKKLPQEFLDDLSNYGYINPDGALTNSGVSIVKKIAEEKLGVHTNMQIGS